MTSQMGAMGETDHEVTAPPLEVGVAVVMVVPLVSVTNLDCKQ